MRKKLSIFVVGLLLLCVISACASGSNTISGKPEVKALDTMYAPAEYPAKITLASVPMITDPSKVPAKPDSSINKASLAGIDSNSNGIRDDVERWIASEFDTPQERALVAQCAKGIQATVYYAAGKMSADEALKEFQRAYTCEGFVFPNEKMSKSAKRFKQIMSRQYNTLDRLKMEHDHGSNYAGRIVPHPSEQGITNDNACDIIIEDKQ